MTERIFKATWVGLDGSPVEYVWNEPDAMRLIPFILFTSQLDRGKITIERIEQDVEHLREGSNPS